VAEAGWTIAGTGADNATIGTEAWVNPGNITADDATYANGDAATKNEQMHYLIGSNFGLSVPADAIINGIAIRGQFYDAATNTPAYITNATVYHPTSGFGNDLEAGSTDLTGTPTDYDYGGSTELLGLSWTYSDVNDSTFGAVFSTNAGASGATPGDARCDAIWVNVYYTVSTMAADAGSFTLTGQAVSLLADRKVTAAAGAFALSGQEVTLTGPSRLEAGTGSYTLTGQDVGLTKTYLPLDAAAGSFTLNGQDVSLLADLKIDAEAGAFSLSGQDAGLYRHLVLTAAAGSYALTGQDAALLRQYPLIAGTGSFTLSGQDVAFLRDYLLSASAGSFTLSGQSASLLADRKLDAGAGSFTLTGQDATLGKSFFITADAGSFTLTGQDAALTKTWLPLEAGAGSFTLTGYAVLLVIDSTFLVLTLEGSDVSAGTIITLEETSAVPSTSIARTRSSIGLTTEITR